MTKELRESLNDILYKSTHRMIYYMRELHYKSYESTGEVTNKHSHGEAFDVVLFNQ